MKVSYRMYDQGEDVLLAACDEDLLGKTLEEGDLSLEVKREFYDQDTIRIDQEHGEKALKRKFERCTIANLVGENVIDAAVEAGIGNEDDLLMIEGVPHLQIVRM